MTHLQITATCIGAGQVNSDTPGRVARSGGMERRQSPPPGSPHQLALQATIARRSALHRCTIVGRSQTKHGAARARMPQTHDRKDSCHCRSSHLHRAAGAHAVAPRAAAARGRFGSALLVVVPRHGAAHRPPSAREAVRCGARSARSDRARQPQENPALTNPARGLSRRARDALRPWLRPAHRAFTWLRHVSLHRSALRALSPAART